jgi:hypothetical protein
MTDVEQDAVVRSHRTRNSLVLGVAALGILGLLAFGAANVSFDPLATGPEPCRSEVIERVTMPSPSASAEEVARAFFAAVTNGDYETAAQLSNPTKSQAWLTPERHHPSYLGHLCEVSGISQITTEAPIQGGALSADNYVLLDALARVVLKGHLDTDESWGDREPVIDAVHGHISLRLWRASPASPWRVDWYGGG